MVDEDTLSNIYHINEWKFTHSDGLEYEIVFIKDIEEQVGLSQLIRGGADEASDEILSLYYLIALQRANELGRRPDTIKLVGNLVESSDAIVKDIYSALDNPNANRFLPGTTDELSLYDIWSRVVVGHTSADSATPFKPITLGDLQDPTRGGFTDDEIASLGIEIADEVEIDNIVDYFVYNFKLPESVINNIFEGNYYSREWQKVDSGNDFIIPIGRSDGSVSIDTYERYELDLNAFLQENTLVMYADDTILDDVIDTVDEIVDLTGSASFFFFVGFNTAIWWGKIGMFALRVFSATKSFFKDYFDW